MEQVAFYVRKLDTDVAEGMCSVLRQCFRTHFIARGHLPTRDIMLIASKGV